MRTPRQRFRRLRARRKARPNRLAEQTEVAKAEAREVDQRERARAGRTGFDRVRVEGLRPARLIATWQTLVDGLVKPASRSVWGVIQPAVAVVGTAVAWIAPAISKALLLIFGLAAVALGALVDGFQAAFGWIGRALRAVGRALGGALEAAVTPARALAFVAIAAAGFLIASQFVDYHGVAVSVPQYAGEIGTIADAPLTDLETTGSAHLYLLGVAGLAAIALAVITLRGRWRLGRVIGLIGLAGIAVTLLIDLPQGLDAGRAGVSYQDSEARLIEGFWAQLAACAALFVCGPLLGRYVRLTAEATGRGAATGDTERAPEEPAAEAPPTQRPRRRFGRRRRRLGSAKPGAGLEAGT